MALSLCNVKTNARGRELANHGTALFPVACYADDLRNRPISWHWHGEMEAVVITEGMLRVTAGTENHILKCGDGFFINSGILHGARPMDDLTDCHLHSIVFHPRVVGGTLDSIFWQNYIQPLIEKSTLEMVVFDGSSSWHRDAVAEIETAWNNCAIEPVGYDLQVRSALSQLLFLLTMHLSVSQNPLSEKAMRDSERIKLMLQYIQCHFTEEVTVAMIAQSAMISVSECLRCFHRTIGVSPIHYLRQFRLEKASTLLASTLQSISTIALQCGFSNVSYFTKIFRECKGCTPGEYRKQNRKL